MDTPSFFEHLDATARFGLTVFVMGAILAITLRLFYRGKSDAAKISPAMVTPAVMRQVYTFGIPFEEADGYTNHDLMLSAYDTMLTVFGDFELPMQIIPDKDIRRRVCTVTVIVYGYLNPGPEAPWETLPGADDVIRLYPFTRSGRFNG